MFSDVHTLYWTSSTVVKHPHIDKVYFFKKIMSISKNPMNISNI
jgi:hypothetical protein